MSIISRRGLLTSGIALGFGAYAWHRGIRYPRLSLEPEALEYHRKTKHGFFVYKDLIALASEEASFRAFAPEPKLWLKTNGQPLTIKVHNISKKATLKVQANTTIQIDEHVDGIDRQLHIKETEDEFTLYWQMPKNEPIRFAVIGDTGANSELNACLNRALELDADYLLHLGDFNYIEGEYSKAIKAFNNAPMPCFVSIGNHDFHDNGLIYQRFREELGPMNNVFTINGVRFINLDTAADFLPAHSGNRADLLHSLVESSRQSQPQQQIVFTHRPLKDPRPHDDHQITGLNEVAWLTKVLKAAGGGYFLNGHVHHSAEFDVEGIRQYTVGEGLGHEDIVLQKKVAKLLVADISAESEVQLNWQALNIPWQAHRSETHEAKLKYDGRLRQLEWYKNLLT